MQDRHLHTKAKRVDVPIAAMSWTLLLLVIELSHTIFMFLTVGGSFGANVLRRAEEAARPY